MVLEELLCFTPEGDDVIILCCLLFNVNIVMGAAVGHGPDEACTRAGPGVSGRGELGKIRLARWFHSLKTLRV